MTKQRRIFETLDQQNDSNVSLLLQKKRVKPKPDTARPLARLWLLVLLVLMVVMISVGGMTRLTDSGLSITEWQPLSGALPPWTAHDWQALFEKYQTTDEYRLQNQGMDLKQFQYIYWWEWGHRQFARLIGLFWGCGFLMLAIMRKIPTGWSMRFWALGGLGALQAVVGWWMVHSGLQSGRVDVVAVRLAVHLFLAVVIVSLIVWYIAALSKTWGDLLAFRRMRETLWVTRMRCVYGVLLLQIVCGALVAGLDGGTYYTDWPLMGGALIPPDVFIETPWWRNFIDNPSMVQFIHRFLGYILVVWIGILWLHSRTLPSRPIQSAFTILMFLVLLQVVLGIMTLLFAAAWYWAILHQFTAVMVLIALVVVLHRVAYPEFSSLQR